MMIILQLLLWLLLLLLAALFVITLVPISFSFRAAFDDHFQCNGRVSWLGGLVAIQWQTGRGGSGSTVGLRCLRWFKQLSAKGKPKRSPPAKKKRSSRGLRFREMENYLNGELLRAVVVLVKRCLRSMHLSLKLEGSYGTDNPALTAFICAVVASLHSERHHLHLQPDFIDHNLDLQGEGGGKVVPAVLLLDTCAFLLSAPVRRIWWRRLRISKKQPKEAFADV